MRKLILRNFQSPGDVVMLAAAIRDLHRSNPGVFQTDVRTPCGALWENSPSITPLREDDPEVEVIQAEYPLIHESNTGPWHFIHGFQQFLSNRLGVPIRPTLMKGDIHVSAIEKSWISQVHEITGEETPFWIVVAGGKFDFTIKWWAQERFQQVIDHFRGKILFVQVGEAGHHHPALEGVLDLRGKTDLRQLVRLVYHSQGVLCPVTLLMHLAVAVEVRGAAGSQKACPERAEGSEVRGQTREVSRPKNRACVVIAGGREPMQWEAYPHHQYIHTNGALRCCDNGGCWKSRVVPLGDGDEKDLPQNLCVDVMPVAQAASPAMSRTGGAPGEEADSSRAGCSTNGSRAGCPTGGGPLPRCMDMISAEEVIRRIELYFEGGALQYLSAEQWRCAWQAIEAKKAENAAAPREQEPRLETAPLEMVA